MAEQRALLPVPPNCGAAIGSGQRQSVHLGFNGDLCEPITGHYLLGNGYRAYNPVLMRFNSPDSLSPFGEGGINTYAYCQGDPISFRDPTGHIISAGYRSAIKVWVDPFEQAIRRRLPVARVAPSPRSANAVAVMPSTASATAASGSLAQAEHTSDPYRAFLDQSTFEYRTLNGVAAHRREYPVGSGQTFNVYDPDLFESFSSVQLQGHLRSNHAAINAFRASAQRNIQVESYMLMHMEGLYRNPQIRRLPEHVLTNGLTDIQQQIANLRQR